MPTESITVGLVRKRLRDLGRKDFIPGFDRNFPGVEAVFKELSCAVQQAGEHMLLRDIEINPLNARQRNMNDTDISIITDNNLGTAGKADR